MLDRRADRAHGDIDSRKILITTAIVFIIAVIICLVIVAFIGLCINGTANQTRESNQYAEAFNALPLEERKIVSEFISRNVDENYQLYIATPLSTDKFLCIATPIAIIIAIIAASIAACLCYHGDKYSYYYASDFPLNEPLDYILLLVMFVEWPFLLLQSLYRRMPALIKWAEEYREVKRIAKDEVSQLRPARPSPTFILAHKRFVAIRTNRRKDIHESRLNEAKQKADKCEKRAHELGDEMKKVQREWGEARAQVQALSSIESETFEVSQQMAELEWNALLKMRGVYDVRVASRKQRDQSILKISIRVQISHKDELYDLGDYIVTIGGKSVYTCKLVRSGIKKNATSNAPNYTGASGGFCFGARESEIRDYLKAGRIIDGMTLIVDSLHHVNHHDTYGIDNCFRKVRTIENAKRRLQH